MHNYIFDPETNGILLFFVVDESSITRWRVQGNIPPPPKRSERLVKLFPEFKEDE